MIPEFDWRGLLPKGVYRAGWREIEKRFGGNQQRRQLLKGLKDGLDQLKRAGCRRVYLDGSFVTHKNLPNDVDVCWDVDGVDPMLLDSVFFDFSNGRAAHKARLEQNSFLRKRRNVSRHFWIFSKSIKRLESRKESLSCSWMMWINDKE